MGAKIAKKLYRYKKNKVIIEADDGSQYMFSVNILGTDEADFIRDIRDGMRMGMYAESFGEIVQDLSKLEEVNCNG